jgi:DNA-binding CsgD family transcriptional regulator
MDGVIRACYADVADVGELRRRVLRQLRRVVDFDAAFFAAADPETLLFTAAFADEALVESGPAFLANEFADAPDVNRFATLATSADAVATLDAATAGSRGHSPRWREIMAPLGMGDEARVALRVDGSTWGFLCLHRSGEAGFGRRDAEALRRMAPHLGEAIRRTAVATTHHQGATDATGPGLIIAVDDHVVAVGGAGEEWLARFGPSDARIGDPLPLPLRSVVRRLETLERSATPGPPAAMRLVADDGALVSVHASRLRDNAAGASVALTFTAADAGARASLLLVAHGLTPAQRRIAQLVLRGRTTRQIMQELRISEHTVQDHLKAVFDKFDVRSRRDLVAVLMRSG